MSVVGVDGSPDGWLAVRYEDGQYEYAAQHADIESLWDVHGGADRILIDVPIGLRETSNEPRACDRRAREVLGSPRGRSVFPPPVRAAVHCRDYEAAKATQERFTDGSLGTQTWAICDRMRALDCFLLADGRARGDPSVVREAHPEVCFWALNGEDAMAHSKTGAPLMAFWERVGVLEAVDETVLADIQAAGETLDTTAGNDDLLDAFALAVTASSLTGEARTLPRDPETDPQGLPMEMVYAPA